MTAPLLNPRAQGWREFQVRGAPRPMPWRWIAWGAGVALLTAWAIT